MGIALAVTERIYVYYSKFNLLTCLSTNNEASLTTIRVKVL